MYSKLSTPIVDLADTMTMVAMSQQEIMENLKKLEDPEIAKQVGDALRRMSAGENITTAAGNSALVKAIALALMTYLGSAFATLPGLEKDLSLKLKSSPVTLEQINEIKDQAEDTKVLVDNLNKVLKDRKGLDKPGTSFVTVGDQKLVAKNQHEFEVLQAMVKLVNTLKRNKAKKAISEDTYKAMVDAMVETFKAGAMKPVAFA